MREESSGETPRLPHPWIGGDRPRLKRPPFPDPEARTPPILGVTPVTEVAARMDDLPSEPPASRGRQRGSRLPGRCLDAALARRSLGAGALALLLALLPGGTLRAQAVRNRILRGLEIHQGDGSWELRIGFSVPIQLLRASPADRGELVEIQLELLAVSPDDAGAALGRESLRLPPSAPVPIADVEYDGGPETPVLTVRFERPLRFAVEQGQDFRSISIRIRSELSPLMTRARDALQRGDHDAAIRLLTRLLQMPEHEHSQEAQEMLGIARERKGQLAHAKAEYEKYLELYPDGEAALRVRQRLEAMLTAGEAPAEKLRAPRRRSREIELETYGSVSAAYTRATILPETGPTLESASFQRSDADLTLRLRSADWDLLGRGVVAHEYDFLDGGSGSEVSVSSLFVDARERRHGLFGSLGRQSQSRAGVLGRFDGARLGKRFAERFEVALVGGFPVASASETRIETDRSFGGLSLEGGPFFGALHAEVFAIGQLAGTVVDRLAVGGELRYFHRGQSVLSLVDYDVYFGSLNIALFSGSFRLMDPLTLNVFADRRNSPILTTTNALQGQLVRALDDLRALFSDEEIEQMALDRTAKSTTVSTGLSYRASERLQVAGDVTLSDFSATRDSGGVAGTPGTGLEWAYALQIIGNDVLMENDVGIVALRYFDGDASDTIGLTLSGRYGVLRGLRLDPRLRVDFRDTELGDRTLDVAPGLRLDYRMGPCTLDLEGTFEWEQPLGNGPAQHSFFLRAGLRANF